MPFAAAARQRLPAGVRYSEMSPPCGQSLTSRRESVRWLRLKLPAVVIAFTEESWGLP